MPEAPPRHPARIAAVNATIRRAASVIAVREETSSPEVLLLERSLDSRFLAGYVVFPGGAVDPDDADLAVSWFGTPEEDVRAAAIRELAEEAGLILTAAGLAVAPEHPLDAVLADPPAPEQLVEIAHWVAPEDVPVRFDARYYAVRSPAGLRPVADGAEVTRAWWAAPAAVLDGWREGKGRLYWPTWLTMAALARCDAADQVMSLRVLPREPDEDELRRLPRSVFWDD
jgi:8-oxo-dGTP pyrophosphatase MutT (NUDIX family)